VIRWFRAIGRILRVVIFLAGWSLRMRRQRPDLGSEQYEDWRRAYFGGSVRGILDRLNVQVESTGEFPSTGGILVSNHLGYLDVFVLASLGPTVFVSRSDVAHWPVFGALTKWCSTIYIDRERRDQIPAVIEAMTDALSTGSQVVFFPEGTSGSGETVMPFRASLFGVATVGKIPVHAATLTYATLPQDPVARNSVCWWRDDSFVSHFFGLAGLREIRARVHLIDRTFSGGDRKELAKRCHQAVLEHFEPVTGSEGSV
jgi:1-acyl-sn-glycerol-3-phosphate acyltransferase